MSVSLAALRRRNWRRSRPLAALLNAPLAFGLLVVALIAGGWNYFAAEAGRARTAEARSVVLEIERLISAVKDLETSERGFVLVGGQDELAPYDAARVAIGRSLATLDRTGGGVTRAARTGGKTLEGLVAEKLDFAARVVAQRREHGFEAATELVRTGEGKRVMDAIRAEVGAIQANLNRRLEGIERRDRLQSLILALLTGAAAWSAAAVLGGLLLIRRREGRRVSALLDGVLENAPVGLGFLDRDLRLRHANRALETMSARGLGSRLGAPVWAGMPALEERLAAPLDAALHHGLVTAEIDLSVPTPSAPGGIRHFLMSFYPLQVRLEDGTTEVEGVGLVVSDETLRRQAEVHLQRSEERFRSLTEAAAAIVWTTAPDGTFGPGQTDWSRFTGQDEAAYAGLGFLDAVHPDDREQTGETWDRAVAALMPYEMEHRLRRRDGTCRHMAARAVPILEEDGSLREWVGTHTDITERKEAEIAIAAAKEAAEEANRAKSQFLANMSHELRTPLSAVIGYSEMLQEELEDLGEPSLIADMRKIESNARHLLDLINDVLDISKIEAERMEVYAEDIGVAEMVRDVASTVEGLVEKKGNSLILDIAEDVGAAHTDQTKLRQCLINLLSNAAKFTENGEITLAVARASEEGVDRLAFTVSDTGIGMSPEQVGRLFERFTQGDASTTRRFGGTGLGLSITRAFVRMLGGEIEVTSREGEGTRFSFALPARYAPPPDAAAEPETEPDDASEADGEARRILVIDDDAATRDLLARFLDRDGFAVSTASDGRAGLERARALRPRAILLDVTMPRMDGWSVLRELRADPDLGSTPVIMVTILDEQNLAFSLGATDYLQKPIEWGLLKGVMDRFRPAAGTGPVLVVDDDADARARLVALLTRENFPVAQAEHGAAALEAVAREKPCLILLDLMMPELDGFGFLRALRANMDWRDIPVVVLTAKDVTAEDRRQLGGRADRVIQKGALSLADLAGELRGLLEASPPA